MVRLYASVLLPLIVMAAGLTVGRDLDSPETAPSSAPLPFFYDLLSFRGDTGTTAVVASFAVRVGELDRHTVDGEARYRFTVMLVLADTAQGVVSRTDDTVFVAAPRPLASDHLLHAFVQTNAQPSTTTVERVVMIAAPSPGTGQLYTSAYEVRDYSGDELMLSDIALGLPGRLGGWRRGEATLALIPSSHFPGGLFDVYYEVYNLPRNRPYATEMAIEPVDEAGDPRPGEERTVRVGFGGEASSDAEGTLSELRRMDVALSEGRHRLTVTVTDQLSGRTAQRSRLLQVRRWREGATLVPTCPVKPGVDRPGCPQKKLATSF